MKKPRRCCDVGTYGHTVPMAVGGRRRDVDLCVADLVAALVAANIQTSASCCGHGRRPGSVLLEDGRAIVVCSDWEEAKALSKPRRGRPGSR